MMDYEKRIAALTPQQRELLELRRKKKGQDQQIASAQSVEAACQADAADGALPRTMDFSIFYFSDDGAKTSNNKYELLLESATFADQHGFTAVWVPERHFQDFGGLYPNPAILSAALAMITKQIELRAGSVVLPLHNPVRVAEDWAMIDNLSQGRVSIAFASGWHAHDFVLAPQAYAQRKAVMFEGMALIQKLWRNQPLETEDPLGNQLSLKIAPRPIQPELRCWVTSSGNPDTWVKAAEVGANVLASLIGQTAEELGAKIQLYRQTLSASGYDPTSRRVAIMLHTFIGSDNNLIKEKVRASLSDYLRTFIRQHESLMDKQELANISEAEAEALRREVIAFAFERYFETSSLLGTRAKCKKMVDSLCKIGVDEIACLIDFGLADEEVMAGLRELATLKQCYAGELADAAPGALAI